MAKVVHLFRSPKKHTGMEELREVRAIENHGLEGCAHARPGGRRQVLLMDIETLREMHLTPGIIRENITTEGIALNALHAGQRLRVGEAELEVSAVCEPCELMEEIRSGLMAELVRRRGMMCRVVKGGMLRQGDEVVVGSLEALVGSQPSTVVDSQRLGARMELSGGSCSGDYSQCAASVEILRRG